MVVICIVARNRTTNYKKSRIVQHFTPIVMADKWVNWLSVVDNIINGNTTINSLDRVTSLLSTLGNSYGWIALNSAITVLGSTLTVYDALDGAAERLAVRIANMRDKQVKMTEKERLKMMKSTLDQIVVELVTINKRLRCRLLYPVTNETTNNSELTECLKSTMSNN